MKGVYSYNWLQSFFEKPLPPIQELKEGLHDHFSEVENVSEVDGDYILEIDILPPRSLDCLGHYGVAKEISAIFQLEMNKHYFKEKYSFNSDISIQIQTKNCPRYTVMHIDVSNLDFDPVIQTRLAAIGQKSINPIVDMSNYILYDIGQPTHAFDASKITGKFLIRQANEGEKIILLGGDEVTLTVDDILITNNNIPIGIGGIKGGENSSVDENTKEIYLEIATFNSASIRKTIRRTGITSDAGSRFSQGIPPEFIDYSAYHAAFGKPLGSASSSVPLAGSYNAGVSVSEVNQLLGTEYTTSDITNTFERLGFEYTIIPSAVDTFIENLIAQVGKEYKYGSSVLIDAPNMFDCSSLITYCAALSGKSFPRVSINQYFFSASTDELKKGDLVFYGIPGGKLKLRTESLFESGFPIVPGSMENGINHVSVYLGDGKIIHATGDCGCVEIRDFSETDVVGYGRVFGESEERITVKVPVERKDIRLPVDLIEEVARIEGINNISSDIRDININSVVNKKLAYQFLFLSKLLPLGYSEVMTYSLVDKGNVCTAYPIAKDKGCLRTNLTDGIKECLKLNIHNKDLLGLDKVKVVEFGQVFTFEGEETRIAFGISSGSDKEILESTLGVSLGEFVDGVLEISFDELISSLPDLSEYTYLPSVDVQYAPFSKYPFVLRDVAVWVPSSVSSNDVRSVIDGNEYIQSITLFDEFNKDDQVSYAFRIAFQSPNKTLTDEETGEFMKEIEGRFSEKGWTIR